MNGGEYIAEFLAQIGSSHVFTLTGGASAFMIDAVARHPALRYTCFQNEQAAAMAADAVWRVSGKIGVTIATSGPGATNLITGIASSYFDSIPSLHITGQVNQRENSAFANARLRQAGFQETRIAEIVRPITKYSVMVRSPAELRAELAKACTTMTSGRMGPVLVDVPMDIQQMEVEGGILLPSAGPASTSAALATCSALSVTLAASRRPLVLVGAGVGLAGAQAELSRWLSQTGLPFVSSWGALSFFDHDHSGYCGQIGVYGNRGANFVLQNADTLIVLGSRLDNRQRSNKPESFAPRAIVHVLDVDGEELKKYAGRGYRTNEVELKHLPMILAGLPSPEVDPRWLSYVAEMRKRYLGRERSTLAEHKGTLSPYDVVRRINEILDPDAIVVGDTGAAVCWLNQAFKVKRHVLFSAGGNSPMGYALPAAIGSKLSHPSRQVVAYQGDGGFQLNIQELQTLVHHKLDIVVVIMNNCGYGIIRQFQDTYLGGRYIASADGYSSPDFGKIARAYGLRYARIARVEHLTPALFTGGAIVLDVMLDPHTLIEPKMEMGRPINDQFPYLSDEEYEAGNRFVSYPRT
jgi:acetolactate synthase-1/2/3 large subunit